MQSIANKLYYTNTTFFLVPQVVVRLEKKKYDKEKGISIVNEGHLIF